MIAAAGARSLARGERHGLDLDAFSRVPCRLPMRASRAGERGASARAFLERHGLAAHRDRGQNFLADERVAERPRRRSPVSRRTTR